MTLPSRRCKAKDLVVRVGDSASLSLLGGGGNCCWAGTTALITTAAVVVVVVVLATSTSCARRGVRVLPLAPPPGGCFLLCGSFASCEHHACAQASDDILLS